MLPHPLNNFEIQKYYHNKPKFNAIYSRNDLSKRKDRAYIINLDEYELTEIYWVVLSANTKNVTYFDSFGGEYISKEI